MQTDFLASSTADIASFAASGINSETARNVMSRTSDQNVLFLCFESRSDSRFSSSVASFIQTKNDEITVQPVPSGHFFQSRLPMCGASNHFI